MKLEPQQNGVVDLRWSRFEVVTALPIGTNAFNQLLSAFNGFLLSCANVGENRKLKE